VPVPTVSIIICTYNRAELLRQAIASVLRQTFSDFELSVVDDGSTDETEAAVRQFGDVRIEYLRLPHSARLSRLRNAGMERSRAPLIAFLDSDDLWREDKLAFQVGVLNERPEAGFIVSGYDIFNSAGLERTKLYLETKSGGEVTVRSIFDTLIRGELTLCSSSIVFRSKLLGRTGSLNESLQTGDYEFYTRLAWESPAAIIHLPLVAVRKHEGNASASEFSAAGLEEAIYAVERFYSLGTIANEVRDRCLGKYRSELAAMRQEMVSN
jgi:glycosyltransferase involved in cell wall biosynthesis